MHTDYSPIGCEEEIRIVSANGRGTDGNQYRHHQGGNSGRMEHCLAIDVHLCQMPVVGGMILTPVAVRVSFQTELAEQLDRSYF